MRAHVPGAITFVNDAAQVFSLACTTDIAIFKYLYVVVMQEVLLARLRSDWRERERASTVSVNDVRVGACGVC